MPTILLVDDDPFNRDGLRMFLQQRAFDVLEAGDEAMAWEIAITEPLDVAVIDIVIPTTNQTRFLREESRGIRLADKLKRQTPSLGIVLFSAYADRGGYLFDLIQAGYRGIAYKLKGCQPRVLLEAIWDVQAGAVIIDPEVTNIQAVANSFVAHLDPEEALWVKQAAAYLVQLTPREIEIARRVAASHNTDSIATMLFLAPKTVENNINRIYHKLGLSNLDEEAPHLRKVVILAKAWMLYEFQKR